MRINTLFSIRIVSLIFFTIFIFLCYHSMSTNAQWDFDPINWNPYSFTNVSNFTYYPTIPSSFDTLWANWGVKMLGSQDSFLTQGIGLSCPLFPQGTGIPYCPGTSIRMEFYWRDPGRRLRKALQWYGAQLPYGSVYTIYPIFPRGNAIE